MKSNNRSNNGPANGPSATGPNAAPVSSATGLKVSAILRCFAAIHTYQKTFLLDPSHLCFDLLFFSKRVKKDPLNLCSGVNWYEFKVSN